MRRKTKLLLEENNRAEAVLSEKGQELPPMAEWERLLCTLRDGLLAAAILTAIWLGFGVLEGLLGAGSWPDLTLTIGQLISGAGILLTACGVVYWICRSSFSAEQKKGPWLLLFLVFFAVLCAGVFLRQPVAVLPVPAAVGAVVGLFAGYKILDLRLD